MPQYATVACEQRGTLLWSTCSLQKAFTTQLPHQFLEAQAAAEKATAQAASVTEVRGTLADMGKDTSFSCGEEDVYIYIL